MFGLDSIHNICQVSMIAGADADPNSIPDVFIELPHGATELSHLQATKQWVRQYPGDRHDLFFMANTDQGSPEYAVRFAQLITQPDLWQPRMPDYLSSLKVLILRCLLPRTILDVNRKWGNSEELRAAGLTGGVGEFVDNAEDLLTLRNAFDQYQANASKGYELACNNSGFAFNLHTYAPISVQLVESEYIVDTLQRAYTPEFYDSFPKRPIVQLITAAPGEPDLADERLCSLMVHSFKKIAIDVARNVPFSLHPASTSYDSAARFPGKTLAMELSRASLADPFDPFTIMPICPQKVDLMSRPIASAFLEFWAR